MHYVIKIRCWNVRRTIETNCSLFVLGHFKRIRQLLAAKSISIINALFWFPVFAYWLIMFHVIHLTTSCSVRQQGCMIAPRVCVCRRKISSVVHWSRVIENFLFEIEPLNSLFIIIYLNCKYFVLISDSKANKSYYEIIKNIRVYFQNGKEIEDNSI